MYPTIDVNRQKIRKLPKIDINLKAPPGVFPQIQKPTMVGYFSVNSRRDYVPDASNLRYWYPPQRFPLDLNAGYEAVIKKPEAANNEGLDNLLKFIFDNKAKLYMTLNEQGTEKILNTEFVCYRGLLKLLMVTPYEKQEDWCIHATRYRNTIYLWRPDTERLKQKRANMTPRFKRMSSWGFKYEQYCLSKSCEDEPDIHMPVNECEEFVGVFRTKIGGLDVLYGAELDGILSPKTLDVKNVNWNDIKFIELKTRFKDLNEHQQESYKLRSTRDWWCQSFLAAIEEIQVGMRSETGQLLAIENVSVRGLCNYTDYWNPTTCAQTLIDILQCIRSTMSRIDSPYTTFAFYFDAQMRHITFEKMEGPNWHSFLPSWYFESFSASLHRETFNEMA